MTLTSGFGSLKVRFRTSPSPSQYSVTIPCVPETFLPARFSRLDGPGGVSGAGRQTDAGSGNLAQGGAAGQPAGATRTGSGTSSCGCMASGNTPGGAIKLMHRLGFEYIRPKPLPRQASMFRFKP